MSEFWRGYWTGIGSVTVFTVAALVATVLVQYLADLRETVLTCRWCPYRTSPIPGRMRWHLHRHHRDIQRTFESMLDDGTGWAKAERDAALAHPDQRWSGDSAAYRASAGGTCHYCRQRYHRWSRVRGDKQVMHEHCWTADWVDAALDVVMYDCGLAADLRVSKTGVTVVVTSSTDSQLDCLQTTLADYRKATQDTAHIPVVRVLDGLPAWSDRSLPGGN